MPQKTLYKYRAFWKEKEWTNKEFTNKKKLFNHLEKNLTNKNKATNLTDKIIITMEVVKPFTAINTCEKCGVDFDVKNWNKEHTLCKLCWRELNNG